MGLKTESVGFAAGIFESMVMAFTPDDVISAVDGLVHTAVDKDMSGVQKFNWVIDQSKDLLPRILKPVLLFLAQALYDGMVEKAKNGRKV